MLEDRLAPRSEDAPSSLQLDDGSQIAVIGGGPAGSLFSYFLLDMARRVSMDVQVDIYEPRDFSVPAPLGCNMCGGIVSESLVQILAADGINLPPTVVQRGIDSYVLHMDVGSVRIETPLHEKRIAAVHRGSGPRGIKEIKWGSFDGYLQALALGRGARAVRERVSGIDWQDGRPQVKTRSGPPQVYDLIVGAVGVNTSALELFENLGFGYRPPQATKTYICELAFGEETVQRYLGNAMHVFLLSLPRLKFAAIIPKGDYVTVCMLGEEIDRDLVQAFLNAPEVKRCLPPGWDPAQAPCHCSPWMNIQAATQPFADRVVLIGDCGVSRLYKDGIGAAYRTAKAAATTAIFEGISAEDFRGGYWPVCQGIANDNAVGKVVFTVTRLIQMTRFSRHAVLDTVAGEQQQEGGPQRMSGVLWDTFTGSAPYRDVFLRSLHPAFLSRFLWNMAVSIWPRRS
jgi:flavin-dependent dehydrogenase